MLGDMSTGGQFPAQGVRLSRGRDFARQQQPQETFRGGLFVLRAGGLGEQLLQVRDCVSTEADTLKTQNKMKTEERSETRPVQQAKALEHPKITMK